ncbi:nicotinamide mononucleotide transporter [Cryobacterium sp. LW097]|nr:MULTISPECIES: nicotinamide riboside transporter PnuC [unclassified Cryobacterium]ASD20725.1 nicotinamide mononucleotide transporter [Cryobacterium sp. LW097]TFC50586.1 nicotinamide riboside transporter PnuC [Cryobacterium sp. TMB3-1-2]TFC58455.1 nicotinamide riboside transporter PnuC [Cryobacterium sp. TMB1-7]TFC74200.1 nicotinamide riboside transporter PnuC [Cryobacterium sp. TMB3-10]TFC74804.1 nicotinamide riboside transporter PnuC [Cryobacterium sp. TMB3-15]
MGEWLIDNWTEVLGFGTGAACVWLAARRNIWTFPLGIANNLVFIVLFFGAALYADLGLQIVYLVLGVMGWLGWSRHRAADDRALIGRMPRQAILPLVAAALAGTAIIAYALHSYTDSTTEIADAATTSVSLVAQYMLNRRWLENWFVWIAVDVAYVGLFLYKGLNITAALYLLFIGLCVWGLRGWMRARTDQTASDSGAAGASPHQPVPAGTTGA